MMAQRSMVNGTEMGAQEWRDALFLRYGFEPPYLLKFCDNFNAVFYIYHALNCKRGNLVTEYQNELHDRVADLARKSFTTTHVCKDSLIFAGCTVKRTTANLAMSKTTTKTKNLVAKK